MGSAREAGAVLAAEAAARTLSRQQGADPASTRGWTKGKGWGWVWGKDDEVGALNALTNQSRAAALSLAKTGEVFDLGLTYSRRSFKWPGHSPGEIITFRSPDGMHRMQDADAPPAAMNPDLVFWHSAALFISDNVATQIDGLGHITAGADYHWYNGFKEADWGGDWGPRKCDASTIPPIIARGVLVDVPRIQEGRCVGGAHSDHTERSRRNAGLGGREPAPGDVVLVRTGTGRFWGEDGADHAQIAAHDSAGVDLEATKWLVEDQVRSWSVRTRAATRSTRRRTRPGTGIPVHRYLLVDQGVHLGELHYLEGLSQAKAYTFCYVAAVNKIKGAAAGFALRPLALR